MVSSVIWMYVPGFLIPEGLISWQTKMSSDHPVVLPVIGSCAEEFNSSSMEGREPAKCIIDNGGHIVYLRNIHAR